MIDTIENPPAFPYEGLVKTDSGIVKLTQTGMTLRDYFAAAALTGLMSSYTNPEVRTFAKAAYETADAMLRARGQS